MSFSDSPTSPPRFDNSTPATYAVRYRLGEIVEQRPPGRFALASHVKRGLKTPELVIVDGGSGLDAALTALWSDVPVQRCTVHKHRNLLAHAPERLHEELSNDYRDMIYAEPAKEVETRRKAFLVYDQKS